MTNVGERLIFDNFDELETGTFLRATARSAKRVLAIVILSVRLSRPGTDSGPGEIETERLRVFTV